MNLSRMERALVDILIAAETPIGQVGLVERCYAVSSSMADNNVIRVRICHINRKLRPLGMAIHNRWTEGYYICDADKARIRELLDTPKKFALNSNVVKR